MYRDAGCGVFWVAVSAGADCRKSDCFNMMLPSKGKAVAVTALQKFRLAAAAAMPNWADSMNNISGRQIVSPGYFGLAGAAPPEGATFFQQAFTGATMDGAIHSAATQERVVGGVDNGVYRQRRDVFFREFYFIRCFQEV